MKGTRLLVLTALAGIGVLAGSGAATHVAAQQDPDNEMHVFPVQGHVYLIVGPGGLESPSANVTVQTSDDAVVVVDTGQAGFSAQLLAAIRQVSPKPIRFIIDTSADSDHTGGNEAIAMAGRPFGGRAAGAGFLLPDQDAGATIVAHENVLSALSGVTGRPPTPFASWPSETYFNDEHELFNGEAIQIFHEPAAHTDGDSIVFFRRSDVISAGDVFSTESYPRIDQREGGSIAGTIDALNQLLDLAIPREKEEAGTYVIPGHGRVCDEADVVEYRDMVVIIRDRVADLVKKGRTLAQIKATKPSFDYDGRYSTAAWSGDQFVEAVFATLNQTVRPRAR